MIFVILEDGGSIPSHDLFLCLTKNEIEFLHIPFQTFYTVFEL